MIKRSLILATMLLVAVISSGCGIARTLALESSGTPEPAGSGAVGMANPASVHCTELGYALEIRSDEAGNQYGVCVFPNGSECDEWAFYRGECGPDGEAAPES